MMDTRLFLFPMSKRARAGNGNGGSPTSFVAAIAARQTWPYLQVPPDPQLITRFLCSLLPSQSLFVMTLQRGVNQGDILTHLRNRSLIYHVKEEQLDFEGPVSFSPLAALWGRQVVDAQFVFCSAASEDLEWAVRHYGSLDRLRVFAVAQSDAQEVQRRLSMPWPDVSYDDILDRSHFVALFDYDWDYFFCFSRKLTVSQLVNEFRIVCQREGVAAETITDQMLLRKVFRRAEKLLYLPTLKEEMTPVRPR